MGYALPVADPLHVFRASRLTAGNLVFPTRIEVSPHHVARVKPRWFGRDEETIAMHKVASVTIRRGVLWADLRIDSSGGSAPLESHGHRRGDADRIRDLIQRYQRTTSDR